MFLKKDYILNHPQIKKENGSKLIISKSAKVDISGNLIIGTNKVTHLSMNPANLIIRNGAEIKIGNNVLIGPGVNIIVNENAKFSIGDNTYIAADSKIYSNYDVSIGNDCVLSWGLTIIDTDFHKITSQKSNKKNITIKNHVWVGANVTILKGVTINEGVVVGAGSVIRNNIPNNALVVGNPGKVVRRNVFWE